MKLREIIGKIFHGRLCGNKLFIVGFSAVIVVFAVAGPGNNLVELVKAEFMTMKTKRLTREYQIRTAETQRKIDVLKNDPDTLEKIARERFGLASPGDDVYVIEK